MSELAAVIHLNTSKPGEGPDCFTDKEPTLRRIAEALGARGLRVVLTRRNDAYDLKKGTFEGWTYLEGPEAQEFSQDDIGVIRDHAGTLGRSAQGIALEESGVPMLNGPSVRRLEDSGFVMPTEAEVAVLGNHNAIDYDSESLAKTLKHDPKVVRMFFFSGPDELETLAVERFLPTNSKTGKQVIHYEPIDNDRAKLAPLTAMTSARAKAISQSTGQQEISGAFDFIYRIPEGGKNPTWRLLKDNLWQPVPPSDKGLNTQFVDMTVRQMERIINSRRSGK